MTVANSTSYAPSAVFAFFNPDKETFGVLRPQSLRQLESIPDIALAQPVLPRSHLLTTYLPSRFPGWTCAENDASEAILETSRVYNDPGKDTDQSKWNAQGAELYHYSPQQTELGKFSMTGISFPALLSVSALAVFGDSVYAQMQQNLYRFQTKEKRWKNAPLPHSANWSNPSEQRLIPDGDTLLVGTSWDTLRLLPEKNTFRIESVSQYVNFRLLGSDETGTWLVGQDNRLYRAEDESRIPEIHSLANLSKEMSDKYVSLSPFSYSFGRIWFQCLAKDKKGNALVGYNTKTQSWTTFQNYEGKSFDQIETLDVDGKTCFSFPFSAQDYFEFDPKTERWAVLVPKAPGKYVGSGFAMISVDEKEAWGYSAGFYAMARFDRASKTWEDFPMRDATYSQPSVRNICRKDNQIYVGSNLGVLVFDTVKHEWSRLPGAPVRAATLQVQSVDAKAIWMVGNPSGSVQQNIVRFDRELKTWKSWTQEQGLPDNGYWSQIVGDGVSCWALASGGILYRLDPKTERWENISQKEGKDGNAMLFTKVIADKSAIWALPNAYLKNGQPNYVAGMPSLIKWDQEKEVFTALTPDNSISGRPYGIQSDKNTVWVMNDNGALKYDKSNDQWKLINYQDRSGKTSDFKIIRIEDRDKELWFIGSDRAVRLQK